MKKFTFLFVALIAFSACKKSASTPEVYTTYASAMTAIGTRWEYPYVNTMIVTDYNTSKTVTSTNTVIFHKDGSITETAINSIITDTGNLHSVVVINGTYPAITYTPTYIINQDPKYSTYSTVLKNIQISAFRTTMDSYDTGVASTYYILHSLTATFQPSIQDTVLISFQSAGISASGDEPVLAYADVYAKNNGFVRYGMFQ